MAAFPAGPPAAAASSAPWPEGRNGGGAQPLLDEFTAPAEKSALLERSRAGIERLFGVHLAILGALSGGGGGGGGWVPRGLEPPPLPPPPQAAGCRIWLSLLGEREEVRSAKEYIKGLCEPELEEREHYPKDMHCIFVGAQRLFLNCLIQGTSADITILEIGTLNIKGGAEPVVMARSHIQQFVSLFKNNTSLLNGKESDVKKRFKQLVEAHADKYTMDLLILPSSLKKELLNLAQKESCRAEGKVVDLTHSGGIPEVFPNDVKQSMISSDGKIGLEEARNSAGTPVTELAKQMDTIFTDTPDRHFLPINGLSSLETSACKERQSCKRRSSDAEERLPKKQFSLENNQDSRQTACSASGGVVTIDLVNSASSEFESVGMCTKEADEISEEMEYKILVNFFKSMGYSQQIVEKVIGDLGQSAEPLLLLEEIEKKSKSDPKEKDEVAVISQNVGPWVEKDASGNKRHKDLGHKPVAPQNGKRNLVSVLQVQHKVEGKLHVSNCENPAAPSGSKNPQYKGCSKVHSQHDSEDSCISQTSDTESDGPVNVCDGAWRVTKDRKLKEVNFVARGGAETSRPPVQKEMVLLPACAKQSSTKHDQLGHCNPLQLGGRPIPSQKSNQLPETGLPAQFTVPCSDRRMGGPQGYHADPSVTGVQRFLESLKTPYKLELKNEPGRAHLKYIVIDGSNVAIAHGLHKFFSCRGIAIAVDYFWRNGHRKITVFVPQWRTKRDSNITEQHFLTQLQDVGILALTPARVVCGARIASHDDRFLLHLAEKTGGVIVTNDNLREFVDESSSWREIIQKRLLPYTFAGDIFMVPDDPMGRNGPGLERFLQEETSFRGSWTQYGLESRGLPPFGTSHFLMQPENSGQPPKSPLPGLVPALPGFPPAPLANSVLPPHPRSAAETNHLKEALRKIFPTSEQREKMEEILAQHPHMRDLNALSAMVLDLG